MAAFVHAHTISVGGKKTTAPHKRTAEAIERLRYRGAELLPGTTEEVDESLIDGEGRYIPKPEQH